jgi:hypothetical protein
MIHFQISKEQRQCLLGLTKYQPPSAVEEKFREFRKLKGGAKSLGCQFKIVVGTQKGSKRINPLFF